MEKGRVTCRDLLSMRRLCVMTRRAPPTRPRSGASFASCSRGACTAPRKQIWASWAPADMSSASWPRRKQQQHWRACASGLVHCDRQRVHSTAWRCAISVSLQQRCYKHMHVTWSATMQAPRSAQHAWAACQSHGTFAAAGAL